MGDDPWNKAEGKYDTPSSSVPGPLKKKRVKMAAAPLPATPVLVEKGTGNVMLDAALAYAARGWPVHPCNPSNKRPLLPPDRDAEGNKIKNSGGVTKASLDPDLIRSWWRKWPKAMIGVATGRNGLFVVDFDPGIQTDAKTGEPILCPVDGGPIEYTLELLKANLCFQMGCALPASLAVRTAGKSGVHVYFRQPEEGADIRNRNNLPHRIDVRGTGGYVIAPPSVMSNGREYRWLHGDADVDPVEAPARLIDLLRRPKGGAEQTDVGAAAPASSPAPSSGTKSAVPSAKVLADRPTSVAEAEEQAVRRYALAALDGEIEKARSAPNGTRNNTINACGLALGHLVGAGALSRDLAISALVDVARAWPDLDKSTDTITRAVDDGADHPRDLAHVRDSAREYFLRYAARGHPSTASRWPAGEEEKSFQDGSIGEELAAEGGEGGRPKSASERAKALRTQHARLARYNRTDLGNAERFRDRFGSDFRFSPSLGWLAWDGRRWKMLAAEDKGIPGEVLAAVFKMVRMIRREAWVLFASGVHDPEEKPDGLDRWSYDEKGKKKRLSSLLFAWADASESNARLRCVAGLVQPWLTVEADAFDAEPYAINVLNGTLRFRRERGADGAWLVAKKLFRHRREDLITKVAGVAFDQNATCPLYDAKMAWAQPDPAMRAYLHQWGGVNLTGEMGLQQLQFWYGSGANMKSVTIDTWAFVAGDYSTTVGIETFLDQGVKKSGGNPTPDLARLGGIRMLRTSEPERGAQLAEALIKLVTGGEPMAVRFLNKGFFDLRPSYKLTISGNHWLGISGTDNGIWRRVKLIPWESQIADADRDEALPEKLKAEASGIFNRLIAGLLDYLRNGLIEPQRVTDATSEYRDASDPLGRFLRMCVAKTAGARVQSSHLFAVYQAWCVAAGEKEWTNKGLSKAMTDKGFKTLRSNGMQWLDIELVKARDDFVDADGKAITLREEPEDPPPIAAGATGAWGDDGLDDEVF